MPSTESILAGLTEIANQRRLIAEGWHVGLGVFVFALAVGWRPSSRVLGGLLVAPVVSVAAIAWVSGNPFNAATFALLAALLTGLASRWPRERAQLAAPALVWAGAGSFALGWLYPHFLRADSWIPYLYASPFALIPCPTLLVVTGVTLMFRNAGSNLWRTALAAAGLFYGALGVFRLGVQLDWVLLASSVLVGATAAWGSSRSAGAAVAGRTGPMEVRI